MYLCGVLLNYIMLMTEIEFEELKQNYQSLLQSVNLIGEKILMIDEKLNQKDNYDKGTDYKIYQNKVKINEIIRYLSGTTDRVPDLIN